ncbi:MAG: aldolase/citrate lyase family protein [Vampirovibrionales bacterium]|nr:aldolase/citrate lyase family protein [Vampirovibrionales bacterium]
MHASQPLPAFRQRLINLETLFGLIVQLSSTESITQASTLGYDWLWLDLEHTMPQGDWLIHALNACQAPCAPLVRIPDLDAIWIKKALDAGAEGIICPMVDTPEQAQTLVALCKYPPRGKRSAGPLRAAHYGLSQEAYLANANDKTVILAQIESVDGVRNADAILNTEGIDGLILGPLDLSASLGVLGQPKHAKVLAAVAEVSALCKAAQKPLALYCPDAESLQALLASGVTLPVLGMDVAMMAASLRRALTSCQQALMGCQQALTPR